MIALLCLFISACAAKLTTIRPTLITRIVVEDLDSGSEKELLRKSSSETDWLMDDLVFQMEQQYRAEGPCAEDDGHRYHAEYYMGDRLELDVYINGDGSVCKSGKRYSQQKEGDNDRTVDLNQWAQCFATVAPE